MPSVIPLRYRRVLRDPRVLGVLGVVVLIGLPLFLFGYWWQPERVVLRRFEGFLGAVENKSWNRAEGYLWEDYEDAWGQDRERTVDNAAEVLQGFIGLQVEREEVRLEMAPEAESARVRAVLMLSGRPTSYPSQAALEYSRDLLAPWEFDFVKTGAMPWAWKIRGIANEDLHLSEAQLREMERTIEEFRGE